MSATSAISLDRVDMVVIDGIVVSKKHYAVMTELAALNEQDLARFISEELEFCFEDMAFNDPDHIAKHMIRKWKKALGKDVG